MNVKTYNSTSHIRNRILIFAACVAFGTAGFNSEMAWSQNAADSANKSVAAANLAAAKELSAASGRPIFAIAGRST